MCYSAIPLKGFSHFSSLSRLSLESSFSIATFYVRHLTYATSCRTKGLQSYLHVKSA
jgi:hypothetical protein